jgi:hypothetical protein
MRAFKTRAFARWARGERLDDVALASALLEIEYGMFDASLGGHVFKKRVSLPGRGKRGSTRTLVAFKSGEEAFFIYGFMKSDRANISGKELKALKLLAKELFSYSPAEVSAAVQSGELIEIVVKDHD